MNAVLVVRQWAAQFDKADIAVFEREGTAVFSVQDADDRPIAGVVLIHDPRVPTDAHGKMYHSVPIMPDDTDLSIKQALAQGFKRFRESRKKEMENAA